MASTILSIILTIALIFSMVYGIIKRKRAGITGIKSALSSMCLFLLVINNLFAFWFDFLGIISWGITIALLMLAAYFSRYIP